MVELALTLSGEEAGLCLVFLCYRLISRIARDLCAFSSGGDNKIRSAFVPHHRSTSWVATVPCCSVASVRNVCKRLVSSAAAAAKRRSSIRGAVLASHTILAVSTPFSPLFQITQRTDLHAVLCRAISRISIVVSYCPMESCRCLLVSVLLVVSMMLTVSCVTCELHGFQSFFSVFVVG